MAVPVREHSLPGDRSGGSAALHRHKGASRTLHSFPEVSVEETQFQDLPHKTLLRPNDVASFLSVSLKTVYRWYRLGEIKGTKIKGSLRIYRNSVLQLVDGNEPSPDQ
jgi:excisionase family DNA binding protein